MYNQNRVKQTSLIVNESTEGESIEKKIRRIMKTGEPIQDGAPLIFTERKDGVLPEYDIRTDRFDIAVEAMDKVSKSKIAGRDPLPKTDTTPAPDGGIDGGGSDTTTK